MAIEGSVNGTVQSGGAQGLTTSSDRSIDKMKEVFNMAIDSAQEVQEVTTKAKAIMNALNQHVN
ncbi:MULTISPECIES: hypothetical protein [Klebsiella/Raoultella group]|uniref:hypothetical protein n=1 Tax=Klebsiella/Raoultella group TaxID=2890311 RepID=UPI00100A0ADB|nr:MULTISPECIES: hypothetical protein [Klebsiella/Raoultella group]QAV82109.1 hypothetical protein ES964_26920 [Klebsiella pneumoniae]WSI11175.1 hypothetical protein VTY38_28145 [Klebsiella pneumoniae]